MPPLASGFSIIRAKIGLERQLPMEISHVFCSSGICPDAMTLILSLHAAKLLSTAIDLISVFSPTNDCSVFEAFSSAQADMTAAGSFGNGSVNRIKVTGRETLSGTVQFAVWYVNRSLGVSENCFWAETAISSLTGAVAVTVSGISCLVMNAVNPSLFDPHPLHRLPPRCLSP